MSGRFIGAMHGVKRTVAGKPSPTEVAIYSGGAKPQVLKLDDETDEHHFLLGTYVPGRVKKGTLPVGLGSGDTFVTLIEGLSGQLAVAAAHIGKTRGFNVWRIPAYYLKRLRDLSGASEADDHITLALLAAQKPDIFWPVTETDQTMGDLIALVRQRKDAMGDRRSAELRVIARVRRERYRALGMTSIGPIEEDIERAKASSRIVTVLGEEEMSVVKDITELLSVLPHWTEIFKPVAGIGPVGASEILASVKDIRRFETPAKLCAYWGVHLRSGFVATRDDGTRVVTVPGYPKFWQALPREEAALKDGDEYRFFPVRKRTGIVANWDEDLGKQALFKFATYHWKQWWMGQPPDPSKPAKARKRSWQEVRAGWSSWTRKLDEMYARRLAAEPWKTRIAAAKDDKERRYLEVRVRHVVFWRFCRSFVRYIHVRWWALERRLAAEV